MCWSATADLVAGTGITMVGAVCVARVRHLRELPLAALPLLLGVHQGIESVVWRNGGGTGPATLAWAVIALPVLALWVPLGVLLAAPPQARRRLTVPLLAGAATAAVLAYCLATRTVRAEIRGHTLGYAVDVPYAPLVVAGYLVATLGSLLLGGDPHVRLLGAVVACGALLCAVLWRLEFLSTWCALAAVASVLTLLRIRRPADANPPSRAES
ncbi:MULTISPECIES: DUF6629 family protein [unclassified Streptomyces]|uniref:DUF6629 family protein n=1 Tax=unclassified Streptomyces TaxID=2593676 RepID=UPI00081E8E28|nr:MULTISPECIES: DUF6629 family protein [unclassified Streptomyces]MYZ37792.1 hypothetical protein [Streptomyces sp. SID4917]SCF94142.1 hypothetical protein GA0115259_105251 [Streptomyces sp. MnatMP-M17]